MDRFVWVMIIIAWIFFGGLGVSIINYVGKDLSIGAEVILAILGVFTFILGLLFFIMQKFGKMKVKISDKGDDNMNKSYNIGGNDSISIGEYNDLDNKYKKIKKEKEEILTMLDKFKFKYKSCLIEIEPLSETISRLLHNYSCPKYQFKAKMYKNDILISIKRKDKLSKILKIMMKIADKLKDYTPICVKIDENKYLIDQEDYNKIVYFWDNKEKDRCSFYNLEKEKMEYINFSHISNIVKCDNYVDKR